MATNRLQNVRTVYRLLENDVDLPDLPDFLAKVNNAATETVEFLQYFMFSFGFEIRMYDSPAMDKNVIEVQFEAIREFRDVTTDIIVGVKKITKLCNYRKLSFFRVFPSLDISCY